MKKFWNILKMFWTEKSFRWAVYVFVALLIWLIIRDIFYEQWYN